MQCLPGSPSYPGLARQDNFKTSVRWVGLTRHDTSGIGLLLLHVAQTPSTEPKLGKRGTTNEPVGDGGRRLSVDIRRGRWIRRLSLSPPCLLHSRDRQTINIPSWSGRDNPPKRGPGPVDNVLEKERKSGKKTPSFQRSRRGPRAT